MEREERLRRWREQYRARRDRESEEERQARLERCRVYERRRYAAMTTKQRRNLSVQRRERERTRTDHLPVETQQPEQLVDNQYRSREFPSFDDPSIVHKVIEFHNSLMSLTSVKCSICLEKFPTVKVDTAGTCTRCHADKHSPKLYSVQNNMDPGPVPPELTVS